MKSPLLLKTTYRCWGIPLVPAFFSLFGFWLSRSDFFLGAGVLTLMIGGVLTCTGLILLSLFVFINWQSGEGWGQIFKKRVLLPATLLLLNFPIAFAFLSAGIYLQSLIYLHISNKSPQNIKEIVISSALNNKNLGSLKSGDTIKTYFSPKAESPVVISVRTSDSEREAVISDYPFGSHDDSKVIIKDNLDINILRL